MIRYRAGSIGVLMLLAVPLVAAAGDEVVRIGAWGWILDAPTKVADGAGLFAAGRSEASPERIEVVDVGSGVEAIAALEQGRLDFALAAQAPVARSLLLQAESIRATNPSFVILASLALAPRAHYLIADGSRGIRIPADLEGRRLGILRHSSAHFAWQQFARQHGLDPAGVELVDVTLPDQALALTEGRVDAIVAWDPWSGRLLRELGAKGVVFGMREFYSANWLLLARTQLVDQRPAVADRVLAAYAAALALMDGDRARARGLHAAALGLDPAELAPLEDGVIWQLGLGWSVLSSLEAALDWLAAEPEFAGRPRPRTAPFIDAGPMLRVAPESLALPSYLTRTATR
ncbi:MAG: transporter substrate-binding domain-containing protein [Gammaproteobacteria bacterium]|nr:MAG: transporter substrate-binding domain-containing protein [Gammaproteobacteria bacterium]